jgi:hypothetical protein
VDPIYGRALGWPISSCKRGTGRTARFSEGDLRNVIRNQSFLEVTHVNEG